MCYHIGNQTMVLQPSDYYPSALPTELCPAAICYYLFNHSKEEASRKCLVQAKLKILITW